MAVPALMAPRETRGGWRVSRAPELHPASLGGHAKPLLLACPIPRFLVASRVLQRAETVPPRLPPPLRVCARARVSDSASPDSLAHSSADAALGVVLKQPPASQCLTHLSGALKAGQRGQTRSRSTASLPSPPVLAHHPTESNLPLHCWHQASHDPFSELIPFKNPLEHCLQLRVWRGRECGASVRRSPASARAAPRSVPLELHTRVARVQGAQAHGSMQGRLQGNSVHP